MLTQKYLRIIMETRRCCINETPISKSTLAPDSLHSPVWKGTSIIIWLLLQEFGILGISEDFFFSTGFGSFLALVVAGAFSESRTFLIVALAVMCLAFLTFWVFFVLLAINRSSAGLHL